MVSHAGMTTVSVWTLFLLCLVTAASTTSKSSSHQSKAASTCPFRTVNYITHSLPQQCLASPRGLSTPYTSDDFVASSLATSSASSQLEDEARTTSISTVTASTNHITPRLPQPIETVVVNEVVAAQSTVEEDSELESGNFLSFEEWKKQNLKKAGQSEHVGRRGQADVEEPRHRSANVQNSLETLGEDGEIDIDFSGFVPGGPDQLAFEKTQPLTTAASEQDEENAPKVNKNKKDAGTTSKERSNYASFDCAANLLKYNKGAKNPTSVLLENKDSYMLNQCSIQDKYIVLELCDDILIDTVVLANFEFFSSTFRTFRVSVSDRWPVKTDKWKTLGLYEAHNTRQVQAFLVENPLIWARYIRLEFLTHYGNEYYCPLSLVRVHGITMIEEWKSDEGSAFENENEEAEQSQHEDEMQAASSVEAVATVSEIPPKDIAKSATLNTEGVNEKVVQIESSMSEQTLYESVISSTPASVIAMEAIMSVIESSDVCTPAEKPTNADTDQIQSSTITRRKNEPSPARSASTPQITVDINVSQVVADSKITTTTTETKRTSQNTTDHMSAVAVTENSSQSTPSQIHTIKTSSEKGALTPGTTNKASSASTVEKPRSSSTSSSSQPAVPSTQESFFKTVQKRLQMLEANSSLSLQYIEDQSRSLRDAFKKVEQRQLSRTTTFLEQLNQTVLYELREFRQQYDQLWQSTVIELEMQRERYQRDNEAIHARISILADEVIFQRRMAVLQMLLILVCLALVLFSRGAINNYLELPLVQNVLARSPSARWLNLSTDSLLKPGALARTRSAQSLRTERTGILKGHRRIQSEDSITDTQSGNDVYAPPTPISDYGHSEVELGRDDEKSPIESDKDGALFEDPEFDPSTIERPATSPPVLHIDDAVILTPDTETSGEESLNAKLLDRARTMSNGDGASELALPENVTPAKRLSWKLPDR